MISSCFTINGEKADNATRMLPCECFVKRDDSPLMSDACMTSINFNNDDL